jgi:hypothetical protein
VTGGKAAKSGSGANGSGQPATADSQGFATADSDAGIPLTAVLGAVFSLAAVSLLLGAVLRKRRR